MQYFISFSPRYNEMFLICETEFVQLEQDCYYS